LLFSRSNTALFNPANNGENIWILDPRSYRSIPPANNAHFGIGGQQPVNVSGNAVFACNTSNYHPTSLVFNTSDNGYPVLKFNAGVSEFDREFVKNTNVSSVNSANSLTYMCRIKYSGLVNPISNSGLFEVVNNAGTNYRFLIYFEGSTSGLVCAVGNDSTIAYRRFIDLNQIVNKWVTLIFDYNYVTRSLRFVVNGILVFNATITEMSTAPIPNTNSQRISVFGWVDKTRTFLGSISYCRLQKNSNYNLNDFSVLHNQMEYATLAN
jgi:hypothetical protein